MSSSGSGYPWHRSCSRAVAFINNRLCPLAGLHLMMLDPPLLDRVLRCLGPGRADLLGRAWRLPPLGGVLAIRSASGAAAGHLPTASAGARATPRTFRLSWRTLRHFWAVAAGEATRAFLSDPGIDRCGRGQKHPKMALLPHARLGRLYPRYPSSRVLRGLNAPFQPLRLICMTVGLSPRQRVDVLLRWRYTCGFGWRRGGKRHFADSTFSTQAHHAEPVSRV